MSERKFIMRDNRHFWQEENACLSTFRVSGDTILPIYIIFTPASKISVIKGSW